ncbi:MAG: hypothetical protein HFF18_10330 [Oscillospiraceae bacterium]|nr:hypothetical protein [Oscillospiraceae bacterium]
MTQSNKDAYCAQVCARVRFRPARAAIARELAGHIEDRKEAWNASGLSPEEAEAKAIAAMGDPAELGKALDRAHPCVWSYLFWVLKPVTIAVCACCFFYFALLTVVMVFHVMIPIPLDLNGASVVRYVKPNLSVTLNGHHVNIEQVYELDDGTIGIQYTDWIFLPHYSSGSAGVALPDPDTAPALSGGSVLGHHAGNGVFSFHRSLHKWSDIPMDGHALTVFISAGMQTVSREIVLEELP